MEAATKKRVDDRARREGLTEGLRPTSVAAALVALFALNLLLRVFYLRYDFVNGDEAIRALTATGLLDGARLYVDIVTDKPPATTFWYAAVFALFGRSMKAIHLAAAVWNFATAMVLYALAARRYSRRTGLWAAALFIIFSTTYLTHDMMAANTELLMALPYANAFYFYLQARGKEPAHLASFAAGLLTGVAVLFKQLGIFNLAFFALAELLLLYGARKDRSVLPSARRALTRLIWVGSGILAVLTALVAWLQAIDALADFWRSVFVMNTFYISSMPPLLWLKFFVARSLGYVLFNLALWALAARAGWRAVAANGTVEVGTDRLILLWAVVSLAAVLAGGRFFGHYFLQVLPALSLLAARGAEELRAALADGRQRRRARIVAAGLLACFLVGFVRFHQRTAILIYESLTGARTPASARWGMSVRQEEADVIAQKLRGRVDEGEAIYIWDYALDVYWQTHTRPAGRYITPNHVTGIFTDAEARAASAEEAAFWAESRRRLIDDLGRQRPRLLLDVTGGLLNLPYPDLVDFVRANYHREDQLGLNPSRPFVVYRRNEP